MKIEENNNREQAITDLKLKLHDGFSHILGENNLENTEEKIQQIEMQQNTHENEGNNTFIDEAKSKLSQIQDIAPMYRLHLCTDCAVFILATVDFLMCFVVPVSDFLAHVSIMSRLLSG